MADVASNSPQPTGRRNWRFAPLGTAVVVAVVTAVTAVPAILLSSRTASSQTQTYTLSGKVMCMMATEHPWPVGIWVDTYGESSGFATLDPMPYAGDGWGWSRYTRANLPIGSSFHLNVGCGGNRENWGKTVYSDTFQGRQTLDLVCNGTPPIVALVRDALFGRIAGRLWELIDAAGNPVTADYGRCVELPHNARLVPTPTPVPTMTTKPVPTTTTNGTPPTRQPTSNPPPLPSTVVHYTCADSESETGHFVGPSKFWNEGPFHAAGTTIRGGWLLVGAHEDGRDHPAVVEIWTGQLRSGQRLGAAPIQVRGYDGEDFSFSEPIRVTTGQELWVAVISTGNADNEGFTAYDSTRDKCFVGRVIGTT